MIFYALNGIASLVILIIILAICYIISRKSSNTNINLGVTLIVLILIIVKSAYYFGFQILTTSESIWLNVTVLGVSFYSLQSISYLVDIKDGKILPETRLNYLALFISFFPQSVAGPIHRANDLIPQFQKVNTIKPSDFEEGITKIIIGFFFKLIIADKLYFIINPILADESVTGLPVILSSIFYSYQIYFDFYGYTLIAIGLGKLFGIQLSNNFNHPYQTISLREFWHRWHITLSQWLKDYVYIRLGGSKSGYRKFFIAVLVTFIVSGLWHGLYLNFIIWGIIHAIFYLLENRISMILGTKIVNIIPKWTINFFYFSFITITWVIFRTTSVNDLSNLFSRMVESFTWDSLRIIFDSTYFPFVVLLVILLTFKIPAFFETHLFYPKNNLNYKILYIVSIASILTIIIAFGDLGKVEFLYFRF